MAAKFPLTSDEFHSITGVGDHKLGNMGMNFLKRSVITERLWPDTFRKVNLSGDCLLISKKKEI